ncbi:hypothetical protein [Abiotrophia defectiva]|jgi:hypothetical protein|uniref:hypothetical protein n=1 Tax=Abiotrophia defectiva TaxID=46125 RepID=UPI00204C03C1|nr:hypothetical protein [Abiotrophia defectiva]DAY27989.1 MAG TPA: hypothetical protein [Caudoviricetes sp.]
MKTFKLDNVIRVTDDPYQIENYLAEGYVEVEPQEAPVEAPKAPEVAPEPVVEPVFPTFGTEPTVG